MHLSYERKFMVMEEWLVLLIRTVAIPGSNFGPETSYGGGFREIPQYLQEFAVISFNQTTTLPLQIFRICYWLKVASFDAA